MTISAVAAQCSAVSHPSSSATSSATFQRARGIHASAAAVPWSIRSSTFDRKSMSLPSKCLANHARVDQTAGMKFRKSHSVRSWFIGPPLHIKRDRVSEWEYGSPMPASCQHTRSLRLSTRSLDALVTSSVEHRVDLPYGTMVGNQCYTEVRVYAAIMVTVIVNVGIDKSITVIVVCRGTE